MNIENFRCKHTLLEYKMVTIKFHNEVNKLMGHYFDLFPFHKSGICMQEINLFGDYMIYSELFSEANTNILSET